MNPRLSSLAVPKDLELRVLNLLEFGLTEFSFDLIGAEKLTQLRLGMKFEVVDVSNMPPNFQILDNYTQHEIEGFHRHPGTDIFRAIHQTQNIS